MATKDIVYIALFAAVTAAVGLFPPFPLPVTGVPITVQNIGPLLAGTILGAKRGLLSQVLFIILVAVGLPLLAGGRGGFAVFLGPTGGFLLAWPVIALFVGYAVESCWRNLTLPKTIAFCVIGGLGISYLMGIPWMAALLHLSPNQAMLGSLPFVPGDLAKAVLASVIAMSVRRSYPIINREQSCR
ncbi:biotin biosynthesis protein BioY [Bradyrhizobium sp. CCBAU 51745]|uniref:biotin transporter BioY n=1 Tax=Bradyrhizobium sp. CCBAU 51745 TaxID=1325099 RepID=UPI002304DFED|nr:biotin transporter BioY [Bradyrhizobium sp. CCBAU 51745]MDA9438425.1 biotin biosynthesis protein BioY [Bradyrhizobium sp. CCBAU 51745]